MNSLFVYRFVWLQISSDAEKSIHQMLKTKQYVYVYARACEVMRQDKTEVCKHSAMQEPLKFSNLMRNFVCIWV